MDTLLIHRDQEPSRPIWNLEKEKKNSTFHWTMYNLVSSPNVERKTTQEALQWTR